MQQNEADRSETTGRRQWLASGLRYSLLGGLAILSGHLLVKSQRPECRRHNACRACGAWGSCRLPLAVETRRKAGG